MSKSRWSISNVLRQLRGARNALARAQVRYARSGLTVASLKRALSALNEAERRLLESRAVVRTTGQDRRAA